MSHQNRNTLTGKPLKKSKKTKTPGRPDGYRVVTFTRCEGMEIAGQGRKVRGTLKLWIPAGYDPAKARLEMWVDDDDGPQIQLRPMPDDFVQTRDVISHGMEVVALIEAETETAFFFDDPALQKAMMAQAAETVAQTPFEEAVSKMSVGGVGEKAQLMAGGTAAIGKLQ